MENTINTSIFDELDEKRSFVYADNGQRFANYIVDSIVFYIFSYCINVLIGVILGLLGMTQNSIQEFISGKPLVLIGLIGFIFSLMKYIGYYTIIEGATKGRTVGKLITKTVAVKNDMTPIGWKEAFIRSLCRMIPFEPFSGFGSGFWHDKLSKTEVVQKRSHI